MSGLPGQVNDGGEGEGYQPVKGQPPCRLPEPSPEGESSTLSELTPVHMPLHMTDADVVKKRLLVKNGVVAGGGGGMGGQDSKRGGTLSYTATMFDGGGGTRASNESGGGDKDAGAVRGGNYNDQKGDKGDRRDKGDTGKAENEVLGKEDGLGSLGLIRGADSTRKLTKNQSYRLQTFGTVLPVSGKEAKERQLSGTGTISENPDSPDHSPGKGTKEQILSLHSFKSRKFDDGKKKSKFRGSFKTMAKKVTGVTNIVGMLKRGGVSEVSNQKRASEFRKAQEMAWERLLNDHLENSEPQLRRFLRWKEDYAYFLRKEQGSFSESSLNRILLKRGKCTCPLSKQSCGPMDPYEYVVHCSRCKKDLPPFADQMHAMTDAIGEPDNSIAHRNALGLEVEEERDMLAAQEILIETMEDDRRSIAEGRSVYGAKKHHHGHSDRLSTRRSVRRNSIRK